MAESQIRWSRSDAMKLSHAVRNFNKKINELQKEENKLYLPDTIEYKETKENITTRKELNRFIKSLKRFSLEGAEDLYTTEAGEQITKWERKELGIQRGIAKRRLKKELQAELTPTNNGFSKAQMGSLRYRELQAQIKNLDKIETATGYEFNRLKRRIQNIGTSDYVMRKSIIYRENYIKVMERYENFENYEKLMNRLKAIKNPINFFDYVSKNELTQDLTYQSDQFFSQKEFNRYLEELGIDLSKEDETMFDIVTELDENNFL